MPGNMYNKKINKNIFSGDALNNIFKWFKKFNYAVII